MSRVRWWVLGAVLVALAIPSYAQRPRGFGGFGGFHGRMGLVMMGSVQKELKLEPVQIELLKQLGTEMQEKRRGLYRNIQSMASDEREKQFATLRADEEKHLDEILEPGQSRRLRQLEIQQAGLRALDRREVAEELKLTSEQRQRIREAMDAERSGFRALFTRSPGGPSPGQHAKFHELRTATDARLGAVLTDTQKQQFQAMQGPRFSFGWQRPPERER